MRYRYFPGCSIKDPVHGVEDAVLVATSALGIELEEFPQWQCCGAVFPLYEDEIIPLLSPVRALVAAEGEALVSVCAACHHVLKRTQELMRRNPEARRKATDFLKVEYAGEGRVLHLLELLRDDYGFERLKDKVQQPLLGQKIACYYGCLLLRPPKIMQLDDPENPMLMEDLISSLGALPVITPYRVECCGSYLSVVEEQVAGDTASRIISSAQAAGADGIVTACPLCRYNLENFIGEKGLKLPVFYFSELLVKALGLAGEVASREVGQR